MNFSDFQELTNPEVRSFADRRGSERRENAPESRRVH
jgi:hypothetical protein